MRASNLNKRECCEWRESLEFAIQKGNREIMGECFYNWISFGEKNGQRFTCSNCQKTLMGWGEISGVDFANSETVLQEAQTKIKSGEIKCCEMVKLVDLNYPDKSFIQNEFLNLKVLFGNKMCYACQVKIEGVSIVLK